MEPQELAHRSSNDVEVTLWFRPDTQEISLNLWDENGPHQMIVDPINALDAFHHPYCYIKQELAGFSVKV